MARCAGAGYFDLQPDSILIIVYSDIDDFLYQTAGRALVPEYLA